MAIIFLLICLLATFLFKDSTSENVLSGNHSTLIVQGENSIVKIPDAPSKDVASDKDKVNIQKQQQALLEQQIELLENKNRLLEEQTKVQKDIKEQQERLEEQKKVLEERSRILNEREIEQNSESKQTNIAIHIENATNLTTNQQDIVKRKDNEIPPVELEGNWELVAYHLYDKKKNSFMEVAVVKDKIEIRENWYFHSGRFRHIMDTDLSFSGKYEVLKSSSLSMLKEPDLISGSEFIIHAYDVSTNFGSQIQHQYYYVEFDGTHLILYDIGRQLQYRQPNQGHEFTKSDSTQR